MQVSTDIAENIEHVSDLIEQGRIEEADQALDAIDPACRLIVLSRLSQDSRQQLFLGLDADVAAEYLHEIPEDQALNLLEGIEPAQAAGILEELPKDEQADFVSELQESHREEILDGLDPSHAAEVRQLIEYDDEEAGGLMILEFVAVELDSTVGDVIEHLQQNAETYADYDVQYVYVVRRTTTTEQIDRGELKGVLPLRELLLSGADLPISELMIPKPISVRATAQLRELHQFLDENPYLGVPVVDDANHLLGVLRRDDVEEAMADRYADDYLKTQGIVNEELRTMPLLLRSRRRLSWLSVNILLNVVAASVIAVYQGTLEKVIALAVFLPIISDMSGCSGNQAVAVSMRELSLGLIQPAEVFRVWLKEIGVGLLNGLGLGILLAAVAAIWQGNPWLGLVVGLALMLNTLIAVSLGGTLPLIMRRLGLDPALASGPILTTVTDMCGFFLVLSFAAGLIDRLV